MRTWESILAGLAAVGLLGWGFRRLARGVEGIDVSHFQGEIDWRAVRRSGIRWAAIKATEGGDFVDPRLVENARGAAAAGLWVQFYHFGRPDLAGGFEAGQREGRHYLDTIDPLPRPRRLQFQKGRVASVWVDLEKRPDPDDPPLTPEDGRAWVDGFLSVVESKHPVGFYSSRRWIRDHLANPGELATRADGTGRPIWVARYGLNTGQKPDTSKYPPEAKLPEGWPSYDVWQYTSKGTVAGIEGRVDRDLLPRVRPAGRPRRRRRRSGRLRA